MSGKTNIASLSREITTEGEAYLYLEHLRWGGRPMCAHCNSDNVAYMAPRNGVSRKTRTGAMSERRVWQCRDCRRQFSVLTGTVLHGTKIEVRTWVLVFFEMCASKNGVAAREIERKYGVCPRTAWFMCHRLREAMRGSGPLATMRGTIVADETHIGPAPKWMHRSQRPLRGSGRPTPTQKIPVLSLIHAETGEVRSRVVPDVTGHMLRKVIAEHVDMSGSALWTDEGRQYAQIGEEFDTHETVNHADEQYVNERGATTNRAEGYFAQLKRSIDGTYHHVSREHLQRYLDEFDYRYSTCTISDTLRMQRLIGQIEGRLTYKNVVSR